MISWFKSFPCLNIIISQGRQPGETKIVFIDDNNPGVIKWSNPLINEVQTASGWSITYTRVKLHLHICEITIVSKLIIKRSIVCSFQGFFTVNSPLPLDGLNTSNTLTFSVSKVISPIRQFEVRSAANLKMEKMIKKIKIMLFFHVISIIVNSLIIVVTYLNCNVIFSLIIWGLINSSAIWWYPKYDAILNRVSPRPPISFVTSIDCLNFCNSVD